MYLGIDLGTSGVKAIIVDDDQKVVAEATAPLTVSRPHPGWSEQDPAHWTQAATQAIGQLPEAAKRKVQGIGLSGQMHGATCLDANRKVVRPAILWNDTRSSQEAAKLDSLADFRALSGNIVFPGFTAPKLVWMQVHEPGLFEQVRTVLLPKDYLRLWLSGDMVSDMSDSAGTSWLDVGKRTWSDALLDQSGMQSHQMPRLVEGSAVSGHLRPDIATALGLDAHLPLAGGAGDNAASAVGLGVINAGDGFVSLGTSGVLFAASDRYAPAPETAVHSFCHALPDRWHQMGVILSATDCLSWLSGLLNTDVGDLTRAIPEKVMPTDVHFLPYIGGERTPLNNAQIRGSFVGMDHASDAAVMTQAVLQGVTMAIRDCQRALEATGTQFESLLAVGGGTRSRAWLQMMADTLNVRIDVPVAGDFGAAFGAARFGMMAANGEDIAICSPPEIADIIEPDADRHAAYLQAHERYAQLRDMMVAFSANA